METHLRELFSEHGKECRSPFLRQIEGPVKDTDLPDTLCRKDLQFTPDLLKSTVPGKSAAAGTVGALHRAPPGGLDLNKGFVRNKKRICGGGRGGFPILKNGIAFRGDHGVRVGRFFVECFKIFPEDPFPFAPENSVDPRIRFEQVCAAFTQTFRTAHSDGALRSDGAAA